MPVPGPHAAAVDADDMERITAAVRTLASLGMIAGRGDTR
jgi:hypothetical protein